MGKWLHVPVANIPVKSNTRIWQLLNVLIVINGALDLMKKNFRELQSTFRLCHLKLNEINKRI